MDRVEHLQQQMAVIEGRFSEIYSLLDQIRGLENKVRLMEQDLRDLTFRVENLERR